MTDLERSQILKLRSQGVGYKQIASALNLSLNTVKAFCRRSKPDQVANACKMCGNPFTKTSTRTTRMFCSDACRMAWWKENRDQLQKKAFYCFTCAHCGTAFESYGASHRKFCSAHCYHEHRRKENYHGG